MNTTTKKQPAVVSSATGGTMFIGCMAFFAIAIIAGAGLIYCLAH